VTETNGPRGPDIDVERLGHPLPTTVEGCTQGTDENHPTHPDSHARTDQTAGLAVASLVIGVLAFFTGGVDDIGIVTENTGEPIRELTAPPDARLPTASPEGVNYDARHVPTMSRDITWWS
jgi:hypothetical protein